MKWIVPVLVALFGVGILVLGVIALRNGDTWDSSHLSSSRGRMINPTSAVLGGAIITLAATYFIVASLRNKKER
jgi:hypothetical protein